jgi:hypothetical protein
LAVVLSTFAQFWSAHFGPFGVWSGQLSWWGDWLLGGLAAALAGAVVVAWWRRRSSIDRRLGAVMLVVIALASLALISAFSHRTPVSSTRFIVLSIVFALSPLLLLIKPKPEAPNEPLEDIDREEHLDALPERETEWRAEARTNTPIVLPAILSVWLLVCVTLLLVFSFAHTPEAISIERALDLTNNVSPLVPTLLLGALAYAFIRWHLDRLSQAGTGYIALRTLSNANPADGHGLMEFFATGRLRSDEADAADDDRVKRLVNFLDHPMRCLPAMSPGGCVAVFLLVGALAWLLWDGMVTIDRAVFSRFLYLASLLAWATVLLSLLLTFSLWRELLHMLEQLAATSLVDAFECVRDYRLDWRLKLRLTTRLEYRKLVRLVSTLDARWASRLSDFDENSAGASRIRLLDDRTFRRVWHRLDGWIGRTLFGWLPPVRQLTGF